MTVSRLFLCLLLLYSALGSYAIQRNRPSLRAPPIHLRAPVPPSRWLQQKLDHFDASDTRTWKQRYWVNASLWSSKRGPVFLMIQGETEASPAWIIDGDMMKNAAIYGALAVTVEHRYYGASRPTSDLSTANLKWLSSRQALQDIVTLKAHIETQFNLTAENKWISFGGSYSGALSAWLRIKYPETVIGAVASSAPVLAKVDFSEYLEVVNASLATSTTGVLCDEYIYIATAALGIMLRDKTKWPEVEKLFNISTPLKTEMDLSLLSQELVSSFAKTVQYNKEFEGSPTIDDLCAMMGDAKLGAPILRYAAVSARMYDNSSIDASFSDGISILSETQWDSAAGRQWYYQTCTEFGYYQTTDSHPFLQPFGSLITLDFFTKACSLVFGISPDQITKAVDSTNSYYGGKDIPPSSVTNIVFPNGSIDPWHALGITSNISDSLIAIYIKGTAHCANMLPPSPHDPPGLALARKEITRIIGTWLAQ